MDTNRIGLPLMNKFIAANRPFNCVIHQFMPNYFCTNLYVSIIFYKPLNHEEISCIRYFGADNIVGLRTE